MLNLEKLHTLNYTKIHIKFTNEDGINKYSV